MKSIRKKIQYFGFEIFNSDAIDLLETLFVISVASILIIRAFLYVTKYPKLGTGVFHIAHMLWGGFFMFVALSMVFVFLDKQTKKTAAIIGGIGFGTFIDELGKFITSDNDYFFQPSIAIIYGLFILFFIVINYLKKYVLLSDIREFSEDKNYFQKIKHKVHNFYQQMIGKRIICQAIIYFFIIVSFVNLIKGILDFNGDYYISDWGQLLSSFLSQIFVLIGAFWMLKKKRLKAYKMYKNAVLISIFLTQFFLFYAEQLSALFTLTFSVIIYFTLQYAIEQEKLMVSK